MYGKSHRSLRQLLQALILFREAVLPTIAVDPPVDNLFGDCLRPCSLGGLSRCTKYDHPIYRFLKEFFPQVRAYSSCSCPQSLLALMWIRCLRLSEGYTNRGFQRADQIVTNACGLAYLCKNKSRKSKVLSFSTAPSSPLSTCTQSLLAGLWIRCSLSSAAHETRGFQLSDQKMHSRFGKTYLPISHGFLWFFAHDRSHFPTIAVSGSVDKLFVDGWPVRRG